MADRKRIICLLAKICPLPFKSIGVVADCLVENGYTIATDNKVAYKSKATADNLSAMRWIPVTERLPEQGQEVIVYDGGVLKPKVFCYLFWNKDYDNWCRVTHWMPLPEPPKEE